jgi:hypothetical protein
VVPDWLAEQLKEHPARQSLVEDPLRLFLLDRQDHSVTLVADESDPGSNHGGSPRWSHNGKRILLDLGHAIDFGISRSGHLRAGSVSDGLHASRRSTDSWSEAQPQNSHFGLVGVGSPKRYSPSKVDAAPGSRQDERFSTLDNCQASLLRLSSMQGLTHEADGFTVGG